VKRDYYTVFEGEEKNFQFSFTFKNRVKRDYYKVFEGEEKNFQFFLHLQKSCEKGLLQGV
jgi:hypothetical protein